MAAQIFAAMEERRMEDFSDVFKAVGLSYSSETGFKVPKDKIRYTACPAPANSEGDGSPLVFLPGVV